MIPRYSRPAMRALFEDEARYRTWLEVELSACAAMERRGEVPPGVAARVRARATIDPSRVDQLEATLRHDVIAFLTSITESAGEEARHLHKGMTSSDLVDTALAVTLTPPTDLLTTELAALRDPVRGLALRHKRTTMGERTHGDDAEPITFGRRG